MRFTTFLKIIAAEICGIAGFLWGDLDGLLKALLVFMIIDYVTGVCAAFKERTLNSKVGYNGILRKVVMLLLVAVANVFDTQVLGGEKSSFRSAVIGFYLANEGLSILENARRIGVRRPKIMEQIFERLRDKNDEPTQRKENDHDH